MCASVLNLEKYTRFRDANGRKAMEGLLIAALIFVVETVDDIKGLFKELLDGFTARHILPLVVT